MTQREEELKPCPFCGYEAELVDNPLTGTKTTAQCRSCGASLFWKKWQNRAEKGDTPKPEATEVSRAICRLLQQQARIPTKDISQRDRDIKTLIDAIPKPEATEGGAHEKGIEAALEKLIKAASDVSKFGAQTGPQWIRLTTAIIRARAALTPSPVLGHEKEGGK